MPNYCDNYLTIEGNPDTLKAIVELVKSEETVFDFEKIVPMPDYIYRGHLGSKEKELYGENNWYDWSCDNWGTKWNSVDAELSDDEFYFQTAWSPARPVVEALAKMFPSMRFTYTYLETGMCFCGKIIYENGDLLFYYEGDYAENPYIEDDEEEAQEYAIPDQRYPIQNFGVFEDIQDAQIVDTDDAGEVIIGRLFYREYEDNLISKMSDGFFAAKKEYQFSLIKKDSFLPQAA